MSPPRGQGPESSETRGTPFEYKILVDSADLSSPAKIARLETKNIIAVIQLTNLFAPQAQNILNIVKAMFYRGFRKFSQMGPFNLRLISETETHHFILAVRKKQSQYEMPASKAWAVDKLSACIEMIKQQEAQVIEETRPTTVEIRTINLPEGVTFVSRSEPKLNKLKEQYGIREPWLAAVEVKNRDKREVVHLAKVLQTVARRDWNLRVSFYSSKTEPYSIIAITGRDRGGKFLLDLEQKIKNTVRAVLKS